MNCRASEGSDRSSSRTAASCCQEGVLGTDASGSDADQQLDAFRAREQVRQANHAAVMQASTEVAHKPAMPNLQGRRVFVDPELQQQLEFLKRTPARSARPG